MFCGKNLCPPIILRNHQQPLKRFFGHDYAVRNIVSAPSDKFLSCSYDLTVRSWNILDSSRHNYLKHHTDFVYGIDICPFNLNLAIDCSWDTETKLFHF